MVRTLAVTAFPATLIALVWLRLEERPVAGPDWFWAVLLALAPALAPMLCAPARADRSRRARRSLGRARHALDRRPARFLRAGAPAVRRRLLRLLRRPRPVQRARAAAHARRPRARDLRLLPRCSRSSWPRAEPLPAVLTVIAGAGWPATLYPVESIAYRCRDPRGRALGARRAADCAARCPPSGGGRARAGRRRRLDLGRAREGRRARLGALGRRTGRRRQVSVKLRLGCELRRHRVPEAEDDRPAHPGPATRPLLARHDPRSVHRRPLDRGPDAALDRPRERQSAERSAPADSFAESAAPGSSSRSRWSRFATRTSSPRRSRSGSKRLSSVVSSSCRTGSCASTAASSAASATRPTATRHVPNRPSSPGSGPSTRPRSTGSSRSGVRGSSPSAPPDAMRASTRSSATSATSRSGPTRRSGTRRSGSGRGRARRTGPSSRSRPGSARPAASATTSLRRPTGGLPPLAHFVAEGKRGYCQHFAGAMALMLRFLGIPARVAAGFTSGKREDGGWTVTDHNAHAWVEVWFPDYGWLAFDPTPGRGALAATYSVSSAGFNAGDAADAFGPRRGGANTGGAGELDRWLLKERLAERQRAGGGRRDGGGTRTLWLLLALVLVDRWRNRRCQARAAAPPLPDPRPASRWQPPRAASSPTSWSTRGWSSARARRRRS